MAHSTGQRRSIKILQRIWRTSLLEERSKVANPRSIRENNWRRCFLVWMKKGPGMLPALHHARSPHLKLALSPVNHLLLVHFIIYIKFCQRNGIWNVVFHVQFPLRLQIRIIQHHFHLEFGSHGKMRTTLPWLNLLNCLLSVIKIYYSRLFAT